MGALAATLQPNARIRSNSSFFKLNSVVPARCPFVARPVAARHEMPSVLQYILMRITPVARSNEHSIDVHHLVTQSAIDEEVATLVMNMQSHATLADQRIIDSRHGSVREDAARPVFLAGIADALDVQLLVYTFQELEPHNAVVGVAIFRDRSGTNASGLLVEVIDARWIEDLVDATPPYQ